MNKEIKQKETAAQCAIQNVRQRALKWWNELSEVDKIYKCSNYFTKLGYLTRNFDTITGREIQAIYESTHVA